jgi:predicted permease
LAAVNNQFIVSLCIIALGFTIKKLGLLEEKDGSVLTRIAINVTLPGAIIKSFSTLTFEIRLMLLPLVSLSFGALMLGLAFYLFQGYERKTRGMLMLSSLGLNVGLFGYPFVQSVMPEIYQQYMILFDVGGVILVFGIMEIIAAYYSSETFKLNFRNIAKKMSRSTNLIVVFLSLALCVLGIRYPQFILNISEVLSRANMPVCMLALGVLLNVNIQKEEIGYMLKVLIFRYVMGILIGLTVYCLIPFPEAFRQIMLICFVLPPPMISLAFSLQYDYDYKFSAALLNVANVVSFLLLWVVFLAID